MRTLKLGDNLCSWWNGKGVSSGVEKNNESCKKKAFGRKLRDGLIQHPPVRGKDISRLSKFEIFVQSQGTYYSRKLS